MAKSLEQLKKEAAKLAAQIEFLEKSEGKIVEYAAAMKAAIREAGFEVADVIKHLQDKKTRVARGSKVETKPESQDSTGAMPERGVTYKHSSWPQPWTASGK